ncbi:MAG: hypothetical protein KDA22_06990 [Phycisphaerales bacterium]|nr:hypothetical protein [Phycisphaerales bacterium]
MNSRMLAVLRALVGPMLALAVLALAPAAHAGSLEVLLRDGSTWRGELNDTVEARFVESGVELTIVGRLVKAERLYVQIDGEIGGNKVNKTIFHADLRSLRSTDGSAPTGTATAPGGTSSKPASGTAGPGAGTAAPGGDVGSGPPQKGKDGYLVSPKKGVFVLPLEGTVGIGLRHEEIEAIAAEADKYGPGQIIVLIVDSPGGLVIEGDKIHDSFKKLKDRHRFVAWIKEAISGAAFTALHCDEIYFQSVGTLGAITMFSGQDAIKGRELDAWLDKCSQVAEMGGRNPIPVRAMIHAPLLASYDKDPVTGKVTWYDTMQGATVLSNEKDNLVFNASTALDCHFSDGTADTTEELAKLLQLPEWYEISDYGRKLHADWQRTVKQCKEEVPLIAQRLQFKGSGSGDTEEVLGTRINLLKQLIQWWQRAPNVMRYELGVPEKDALERQIANLQRQLAMARRARQNAGN